MSPATVMFLPFDKRRKTATFFFFLLLQIGALPTTTPTDNAFGVAANDTDRLALLAIKSKIREDPQGVMSSWNDSLHFCQWQGVTCGHRHKRVTNLKLRSKGLVGTLSPYIGNLSFLREIRLSNNTFQGGIPPEVGRLRRLQILRLSNNSFEGEIPANLSLCSNLCLLLLGNNRLVGKFPTELSSLLKLKDLSIRHNNITGGIPPFIGNLTSLENISLAHCPLGGTIPDFFQQLKNLKRVGFFGNGLVGSIPASVYNISSILFFAFSDNQLTGTLPTNLGSMLPHLQVFEFGHTEYTGSLPPSISNCSDLEIFDVARSNFNGKIEINFGELQHLSSLYFGGNNFGSGEPDELKFIDSLSNCSNFEKLDVSDNQFESGAVPNSLGNFSTKLTYLSLARNSISGSIPASIGNLLGLSFLGLAENQFTGTIPTSICNLGQLRTLALWDNNFSGEIPHSIGNLSLLVNLHIDENKLQGTIPSSLANCIGLNRLSLSQNNLSGTIPRQLFGISSLSIALDLGKNHLSGPIPAEVGNLNSLNALILAGNELSGELPSTLGSCIGLEHLNLSTNFFQGSIPTSFSSLRALLHLDMSRNNFSGQIPIFLEQILFENLNLSFNNFEGEVPVKGVFANATAMSVVGNNRLCGGMPELGLPKCRIRDRRRKLSLAAIIVLSIMSTLIGAAMVSFALFCWCKKKKNDQPSQSSFKAPFLKISYESLLKATEGFSSANLIGKGSFSSVYKGILDGDGMTVAVKVLNLQHRGGSKSFIAECETLRNARHRNLVKVITACSSVDFQGNDFKALVYDFMPNGSLERWLHSTQSVQDEPHRLSLLQRINIALDVACALDYLHHRCEKTIVHCDLKPSNILLDRDMVAHVGDFGLAKLLLPEISNADQSSSIGIRGTIGYAAPEYGLGSEVSTNGDVYSFGILLLEMVTGKKPTDHIFQEGFNLHNYANMALTDHVLEIVDPILLHGDDEDAETPAAITNPRKEQEKCLTSMVKIGVACSMESPEVRMDISNVIHDLHSVRGIILGT